MEKSILGRRELKAKVLVGAFKKDPNERPSLGTVKFDVGSLTALVPSGAE